MIDINLLIKAIGDLDESLVIEILTQFEAQNPSSEEVDAVVSACQQGLKIIGDLFEVGTYYVGDLIYGGELMKLAMTYLKPLIGKNSKEKVGTIVLGTVEGDLHDIGMNIFKSMAEAAGFEVHDIGTDQPPSAFVEKIKEVKPDIVGMSALLTLALPAVEKTIEAIKEAGLRDSVKIIVGGSPITPEFSDAAGADACGGSATNGAKICLGWVS